MLTSKERSYLRALGNKMEPILIIGKSGVTDQVEEQLDQALTARELVKGRVLPHTEFEVNEVAADLASRAQAEIVQVIGRNILFYRPSEQDLLGEIRLQGKENRRGIH